MIVRHSHSSQHHLESEIHLALRLLYALPRAARAAGHRDPRQRRPTAAGDAIRTTCVRFLNIFVHHILYPYGRNSDGG